MAHFLSFNIDGVGNPRTVRIQVGDPIGPATFARERSKPFTTSNFGVQATTRAVQRFPPRKLTQGSGRTNIT